MSLGMTHHPAGREDAQLPRSPEVLSRWVLWELAALLDPGGSCLPLLVPGGSWLPLLVVVPVLLPWLQALVAPRLLL